MVVCKCRKATKLYCFVHKIPVCGECICFNEHQVCVVKTYSEWVIDGDYDWPPKCNVCHEALQAGETATSRLGCLHVLHTSCLVMHLQSFPLHTAPAGYICPVCSVPVWPPKIIKDYNCALSAKLKAVIFQSGLNKALLGDDVLTVQQPTHPPAFASNPLVKFQNLNEAVPEPAGPEKNNGVLGAMTVPQLHANVTNGSSKEYGAGTSHSQAEKEVDEIFNSANGAHSSLSIDALSKIASPAAGQPGYLARKNSSRVERTGQTYTEIDGDDDDAATKKYSRHGPLHKHAFRYLLPFWSHTMPTLPITSPSRKDEHIPSIAEELSEGRPRRRSRASSIDTRKILLVFAIMSCMATMMLLYHRLLQGTPGENIENN